MKCVGDIMRGVKSIRTADAMRIAARGIAGLALTGLAHAQNVADAATGTGIITQLCPVLKLLPIFGGVAMTSGLFLAAYNYMSSDQEARQKGKSGAEGLMIGAGLISVAPAIVAQVMGINVLGICPIV